MHRRAAIVSWIAIVILAVATAAAAAGAPWAEDAKLTAAADANKFDSFGWAVGVSGNTAIVGARADGATPLRNGSVYIFNRVGNVWAREARLTASDASPNDRFGTSVAINGDTAIVGALGGNSNLGAAYVFVRNGALWTEQQILKPDPPAVGDACGYAVGISGDTAVFSCKSSGQGSVYVFVRSGGVWTRQAKLTAVDSTSGDFFGFSAAISGDTVVVGAVGDKLGGAKPRGSATVFTRSGTAWSLQQKLTASDGVDFDGFGRAVAISGSSAVVTNITGDPLNQPLNQTAYVFIRTGTTWTEQDQLRASDPQKNDDFGTSVAISGDLVLIGAPDDDAGATIGTNEGSAYLFQRSGEVWSQIQKLTASDQATGNPATGNLYGFSVGLSGAVAIVGAPYMQVGANLYQGEAYAVVNPDSDGDGLPNEWETSGVTIDGKFIDLPTMGADPRHKDIFVHVDWMHPDPGDPTSDFRPNPRSLKLVADAFAIAPVQNPDGTPGVNLHVDAGPDSIMNPVTGATWGTLSQVGEVPFQTVLTNVDEEWPTVDAIKAVHFLPAKRQTVFHYALYANAYRGVDDTEDKGGGLSQGAPGHTFLITTGSRGKKPITEACYFMHELGHNLGLEHGGDDEVNYKPNYISIMNYRFEALGSFRSNVKQRYVDYSRAALDTLDELNLDEHVGINDPVGHITWWNSYVRDDVPVGSNHCSEHPNTFFKLFYPSDALDWNCDGVETLTPITTGLDLNSDGRCVSTGPDGVLSSVPDGDDVVTGPFITSGPNRTCETFAVTPCDANGAHCDVQESPVGDDEPRLLKGFDDWPALKFDGKGVIGSDGSALTTGSRQVIGTVLPTPRPRELTLKEILAEAPPALVAEEDLAPLDDVTYSPKGGPAALAVDFDASASQAVNGTIVAWAWDFGDGAVGSGAKVKHTYTLPGLYFASVTVTDSSDHVNLVPLLQRVTVTDGSVPTPTPTATAVPLHGDHFLSYGVQTTKGTAKFLKFGPVTLADASFGTAGYDVVKTSGFANPAGADGGSIGDAATHLAIYAVKASKGSPKLGAHADVRVVSGCGETVVTAAKPVSVLLPTAMDPSNPIAALDPNAHDVDHFLCYQAKPQKKRADGTPVAPFPKGVQVVVSDQFQTSRYDLKKVALLCNPVSKSGTPVLLAGPQKGTPLPITPAVIGHPSSNLLCYQASLAKKQIAQNGCGPATAGDKGTPITPAQSPHVPRLGMFVANQFGTGRLDTTKETLLCLPATVVP